MHAAMPYGSGPTETARHAVASTSQLLRRLDVSRLKLEDEERSMKRRPAAKAAGKSEPSQPVPTQAVLTKAAGQDRGRSRRIEARAGRKAHGGFNPYDGAAMRALRWQRNQPTVPPRVRGTSWWRRLFQR